MLIKYLKKVIKAIMENLESMRSQLGKKPKSTTLTPMELEFLLNNVFELLEVQSKKSNISLIFDREYKTPINVFADEERIQQVITNLIMNSVKYGVRGQGLSGCSCPKWIYYHCN